MTPTTSQIGTTQERHQWMPDHQMARPHVAVTAPGEPRAARRKFRWHRGTLAGVGGPVTPIWTLRNHGETGTGNQRSRAASDAGGVRKRTRTQCPLRRPWDVHPPPPPPYGNLSGVPATSARKCRLLAPLWPYVQGYGYDVGEGAVV
ncbi:hypothetical protein MRX96_040891 [Rhipicephalus microplus]